MGVNGVDGVRYVRSGNVVPFLVRRSALAGGWVGRCVWCLWFSFFFFISDASDASNCSLLLMLDGRKKGRQEGKGMGEGAHLAADDEPRPI